MRAACPACTSRHTTSSGGASPRPVSTPTRWRPRWRRCTTGTPPARPAPSGRDRSRCLFLQRIRQIGPAIARNLPPTALERAFGAPDQSVGAIRGKPSCPTVDVRHQGRTAPHWRFPQRRSPAAAARARPRGPLATPPSRGSLASQPPPSARAGDALRRGAARRACRDGAPGRRCAAETDHPVRRRVAHAERAVGGRACGRRPTNGEIAQALFMTPRTVESHLTSAYRKLEISSRAELAATLGEPSRT